MKKQRYESVWDAIEPSRAEAANMKARAETMIAIQRAQICDRASETRM